MISKHAYFFPTFSPRKIEAAFLLTGDRRRRPPLKGGDRDRARRSLRADRPSVYGGRERKREKTTVLRRRFPSLLLPAAPSVSGPCPKCEGGGDISPFLFADIITPFANIRGRQRGGNIINSAHYSLFPSSSVPAKKNHRKKVSRLFCYLSCGAIREKRRRVVLAVERKKLIVDFAGGGKGKEPHTLVLFPLLVCVCVQRRCQKAEEEKKQQKRENKGRSPSITRP